MRLLLSVLALTLIFTITAQVNISGRVVDRETGVGLIGAHLYLLKDWRNGTTAGLNGEFNLVLSQDQQDSLIVSYVGFQEMLLPISQNMIVKMDPVEIVGETIVVTAEPLIAEEFKYMKISKLDIYTNPAAKADPILAVNALPSATTTDESANISLRGSSPLETTIFLNSVPMYDAVRYSQLNGIGTFSIFNTTIIKDLAVFPGNPPLEFGNSTSGIIALSTDDRVMEDNTNSVAISLANVGFSREQKLTDNQSIKLFSNWQPSGAIKAFNESALEQIESFNSGDLGVYWYGVGEKVKWKVLSYSLIEGYEFNFQHPSFVGVFDQSKRRSFLASSLEQQIGNGTISLNNGLSTSRGNYTYSNVAFEVNQRDLFLGANYLLSTSKYNVKSGISYDHRHSEVGGSFHEVGYALGTNHPTVQVNESSRLKTLEAFAYFKYYASDRIALGTGLRKNLPVQGQSSYLSKQLNVAFTEDQWSIILGAGTYHKNGLIENSGNQFTSRSEQISLDVKFEPEKYSAALSIFGKRNRLSSQQYTAQGLELLLDCRLTPKIKLSTSLTLLDAESEEREPYQYDINYFLRGNLAYSPGKFWTFESILLTRQGAPYNPVVGAEFDEALMVFEPARSDDLVSRFSDYLSLSISINKIFPVSEKFNVIGFLSVGNVLDTDNVRAFDYNFDYSEASPALFSRRTAYFGAVLNF